MNIKLIVKLRNAGFREESFRGHFCGNCAYGGDIQLPAISEIIEACGKPISFNLAGDATWHAIRYGETAEMVQSEGTTLEEALVNLYIALQGTK